MKLSLIEMRRCTKIGRTVKSDLQPGGRVSRQISQIETLEDAKKATGELLLLWEMSLKDVFNMEAQS